MVDGAQGITQLTSRRTRGPSCYLLLNAVGYIGYCLLFVPIKVRVEMAVGADRQVKWREHSKGYMMLPSSAEAHLGLRADYNKINCLKLRYNE